MKNIFGCTGTCTLMGKTTAWLAKKHTPVRTFETVNKQQWHVLSVFAEFFVLKWTV